MTTSEIATVLAWHDALNASDLDTLVTLSSDDIEIGTRTEPRKATEALRRWATSLNSTRNSARCTCTTAWWLSNRRSAPPTIPAVTSAASAFRVVHDHVTSVFRHDDLASALAATELTEADLVDVEVELGAHARNHLGGRLGHAAVSDHDRRSASSCCRSTTNR